MLKLVSKYLDLVGCESNVHDYNRFNICSVCYETRKQ